MDWMGEIDDVGNFHIKALGLTFFSFIYNCLISLIIRVESDEKYLQ